MATQGHPRDVVVLSGKRTGFGTFGGSLKTFTATDLGVVSSKAAFDAADGDLLWHTRIGNISNAPQTYLIDGRQHVLVAAGQQLYAFVMY